MRPGAWLLQGVGKEIRLRSSARRAAVFLTLLGIVAAGGPLFRSAQADMPSPKTPAGTGAATDTTASPRILTYYFHTTHRCPSCRKIEAYTHEAIQTGFPGELKDRRLVWMVVNVEEKGNEYFVKDYQLYTKSVVLVDERNGKQQAWKNLTKVWELLGDKEKFIRYVQEETRAYLSGKQP